MVKSQETRLRLQKVGFVFLAPLLFLLRFFNGSVPCGFVTLFSTVLFLVLLLRFFQRFRSLWFLLRFFNGSVPCGFVTLFSTVLFLVVTRLLQRKLITWSLIPHFPTIVCVPNKIRHTGVDFRACVVRIPSFSLTYG